MRTRRHPCVPSGPCLHSCDPLPRAAHRCLEEAVNAFAGSALVISHDRFFLDRLCTHILAFEGESKVSFFEGGWSEYEAYRKAQGNSSPHRLKFRKLATV